MRSERETMAAALYHSDAEANHDTLFHTPRPEPGSFKCSYS
mgnify:CR=1 FL=1